MLAAEFEAVELSVAEVFPEEGLGGCHRAAQTSCGRDVFAVEFLLLVHLSSLGALNVGHVAVWRDPLPRQWERAG